MIDISIMFSKILLRTSFGAKVSSISTFWSVKTLRRLISANLLSREVYMILKTD